MTTWLFVLIVVALDAWAIWKTLRSGASQAHKIAWSIAIACLPILGLVLWALFGPPVSKPEMYEHEPP